MKAGIIRKVQDRPVHWKYLQLALTLIICWTIVVLGSAYWNCRSIKEQMMELARLEAKSSLNKDILYRTWNARHGGVYAPITEDTLPNPYLDVEEKNIETTSGRRLTLINPAYMTRQVHDAETDKEYMAHITSLNPIRPENRPDSWEEEALETFEHGASEAMGNSFVGATEYIRYMRPFITTESCLKCHQQQGYKVGDIRGGLSIAIRLSSYRKYAQTHCKTIILGHMIIWLVGSVGLAFGIFLWLRKENTRLFEVESMRENEQKFRLLFESSCEAAALLNEQGFIDCNQAALRMLRCFEKEQLIGKHPADFSPPVQPDGQASRATFDKLTEQARKIGSLNFEWVLQRLDGNGFAADIIFSSLKLEGKPCLQMVMRDISVRKKAEIQQKTSQAETERMNRLMTGREQRILELKQEVNLLLGEQGKEPRYSSVIGDEE